jgi:hypothetical protein
MYKENMRKYPGSFGFTPKKCSKGLMLIFNCNKHLFNLLSVLHFNYPHKFNLNQSFHP